MNQNPDNRRTGGEDGQFRTSAHNFKLNLDEQALATGMVELPAERRRESAVPYAEPPSNKKVYYSEKERKQEEKEHKKRNKLKARKNRRVFSLVWLAMVLLVSFTLASYLITGSNDFFAVERAESTATAEVVIPKEGLTPEVLAQLLHEKGVINSTEFFSLYCKVTVDDMTLFVPGKHKIETNLDYEDLINRLQGGGKENREVVTVTIPEGLNTLEIADLLQEKNVCDKDEFLDALNTHDFTNYDSVAKIGGGEGKYYKLEGYLFPDTYDFYEEEEIDSVIGKMLNNFDNRMTEDLLAQVDGSGMTLDQVVTLASIIQAEAANSNDMFKVSAVLHNRLDFGADYGIYVLGCDSTMFYPYKNKAAVPETGALSYGNYDTYEIQGLPAGAICNPGLDAIKAALRPATDGDAGSYLYFCHAADGTAYYATNEYDHEYNKQLAGLTD